MNSCTFIGNLARDPEVGKTGESSFAKFTIAVNRNYRGKNGERATDFINCIAWRGQADFVSRNLTKGRKVAVTGAMYSNRWEDKDTGATRVSWELNVRDIEILSPKKEESDDRADSVDDLPF